VLGKTGEEILDGRLSAYIPKYPKPSSPRQITIKAGGLQERTTSRVLPEMGMHIHEVVEA